VAIDMTKGNSTKNLFHFSVPLFFGSILQNLYNIVDSIIVGRYLGKEALSIVSNTYAPMLLINSIVIGFASGITILISQSYGKKNYNRIGQLYYSMIRLAIALSILMVAYGLFFSSYLFSLMQIPTEMIKGVNVYFRLNALGFPFVILYNFFASMFKGFGDSRISLYILVVSSVINIVMDIINVVVLKLGIPGAAYGTVIAQIGSAVCMMIYFYSCRGRIQIQAVRRCFKEVIQDIYTIIKSGITSTVQNFFSAFSMIFIQSTINTFGVDAISAFSAAYKIESILTVPAVSLGSSLGVFVGQNMGADLKLRIKNGLKSSIYIAVLLTLAVNFLIWVSGEKLLYLILGNEQETIKLGQYYLKIVGFFYFLLVLLYILTNYLRALGEVVYPLFNTILELSSRIVLVLCLAQIFGLNGVFFARPLSFLISAASLSVKSILKNKESSNEQYDKRY